MNRYDEETIVIFAGGRVGERKTMKKNHYPNETGEIEIRGAKMTWSMKRTKTASAFGIRGSRIIELTLKKNAMVTGHYAYGWTKQIPKEDEESALCLGYLLNKYGRSPIKKRKEMGFQE